MAYSEGFFSGLFQVLDLVQGLGAGWADEGPTGGIR